MPLLSYRCYNIAQCTYDLRFPPPSWLSFSTLDLLIFEQHCQNEEFVSPFPVITSRSDGWENTRNKETCSSLLPLLMIFDSADACNYPTFYHCDLLTCDQSCQSVVLVSHSTCSLTGRKGRLRALWRLSIFCTSWHHGLRIVHFWSPNFRAGLLGWIIGIFIPYSLSSVRLSWDHAARKGLHSTSRFLNSSYHWGWRQYLIGQN